MTTRKVRQHTAEFRISIAEQMLAGADVMALSRQHQLARSMMYRWRDALHKHGAAGLTGVMGRPRSIVKRQNGQPSEQLEQRLRSRIAELERKVGQQTVEIDFFKGVFKRLGVRPKTRPDGEEKSTPRSDA